MAIGGLQEADLDGDEESIFAEINITPLTDIFLLLMIIFIVSGSAAVDQARKEQIDEKSSGLKINLPSGEAKEVDVAADSLEIAIDKEGRTQINGRDFTSGADVASAFVAAFQDNKDTQVVIRADKGASHGVVVDIMSAARKAGLRKFSIATAAQ